MRVLPQWREPKATVKTDGENGKNRRRKRQKRAGKTGRKRLKRMLLGNIGAVNLENDLRWNSLKGAWNEQSK